MAQLLFYECFLCSLGILTFKNYIHTFKSKLSTAKTYELISTDEKSVFNRHCNEITTNFNFSITESQERLSTFYWLPKLHKNLTKLVLSQTLAHVQLRVCLKY